MRLKVKKNCIFIIVSSIIIRKRKKRLSLNFCNFLSAALEHIYPLTPVCVALNNDKNQRHYQEFSRNLQETIQPMHRHMTILHINGGHVKLSRFFQSVFFYVFDTNSNNVNPICINIS